MSSQIDFEIAHASRLIREIRKARIELSDEEIIAFIYQAKLHALIGEQFAQLDGPGSAGGFQLLLRFGISSSDAFYRWFMQAGPPKLMQNKSFWDKQVEANNRK